MVEQFELVRCALNHDTDTRRAPSLGAGMLAHWNRRVWPGNASSVVIWRTHWRPGRQPRRLTAFRA